jgi:hypothetical protein
VYVIEKGQPTYQATFRPSIIGIVAEGGRRRLLRSAWGGRQPEATLLRLPAGQERLGSGQETRWCGLALAGMQLEERSADRSHRTTGRRAGGGECCCVVG